MNWPPLRRADDDPRRRRFRKGIYLLPSLFTTLNMALGYYALYHAIQGSVAEPWHYDNAAKAIGFAIIFDGLDGKIARMTNTESDFGREFDSLADVITFGVAPAILAWMWGFRILAPLNGSDLLARVVHLGAIATFAFLIAGASRLARFNIQVNPQPSNPGRPGKKYFVGMPIPAGAGVIAAIVHFTDGVPILSWWMGLIWAALVFATSYLMVSTWRFYSFKDIDFRSRHPFWVVVIIGIVIACIRYFSEYFLFFLALFYMLSGVIARLMYILRRRGSPPPPPLEATTAP
ncbi:MAG: phosphatidylcholine/phosphatidylserine synthase [Acidobacteriia bacterium]|nr:phosphatidylcholine/phosphatidylserine synthase [Terriglobia bacterium]